MIIMAQVFYFFASRPHLMENIRAHKKDKHLHADPFIK